MRSSRTMADAALERVARLQIFGKSPLGAWLRGELREWAEGLLSKKRLVADGIFAADEVRRLWDEHVHSPFPGEFSGTGTDPRLQEDASLIEEIVEIDHVLESAAGGAGTARGSGWRNSTVSTTTGRPTTGASCWPSRAIC